MANESIKLVFIHADEPGQHWLLLVTGPKEQTQMSDRFLDINEVSKLLRVSRETVYREVREGRLPGAKIGGQWRFSESSIHKLFALTEQDTDCERHPSTDSQPVN